MNGLPYSMRLDTVGLIVFVFLSKVVAGYLCGTNWGTTHHTMLLGMDIRSALNYSSTSHPTNRRKLYKPDRIPLPYLQLTCLLMTLKSMQSLLSLYHLQSCRTGFMDTIIWFIPSLY